MFPRIGNLGHEFERPYLARVTVMKSHKEITGFQKFRVSVIVSKKGNIGGIKAAFGSRESNEVTPIECGTPGAKIYSWGGSKG